MLYKSILNFTKTVKANFFVPGHKGGRGIPRKFKRNLLALDITEQPGTDNLTAPTGILKAAQERVGAILGSGRTFFLTGDRWIDASIPAAAAATKREKITFCSDAYFKLVREHRTVAPILALGKNVTFEMSGVIYEISE